MFSAFVVVVCAVVCFRRGSAFSAMERKLRSTLLELESFQSNLIRLEKRQVSLEKRTYLDERRDPETGQSGEKRTYVEDTEAWKSKARSDAARLAQSIADKNLSWKSKARRDLGLIGPNAARMAQSIHQNGGVK
jgi:hypothetical protein